MSNLFLNIFLTASTFRNVYMEIPWNFFTPSLLITEQFGYTFLLVGRQCFDIWLTNS